MKIAGSDTTHYTTLKSNDLNTSNTFNTLDKTSNSFVNIKDIITVTNTYKNMDFTILAVTTAMSIAAPLITGLIQSAINRWNDEVPTGMQLIADSDMLLLKSKMTRLVSKTSGNVDLTDIKDKSVNAKDFQLLQMKIANYMKQLTDYVTGEIIEGFCRKDKDRVERSEKMIMNVHDTFKTSIESEMAQNPRSTHVGNFKYDHALEALERITPSSKVCNHNTFLVRKMSTLFYINKTLKDVNDINMKLNEIYDITNMHSGEGKFSIQLVPKTREVSVDVLSRLYGVDLTLITNAHFFSMKDRQEWYILQDSNLSPEAILENKLGHSISVLGEVTDEIAIHIASVLKEKNPHEEIQNVYLIAEKGPFKSKIRMRQFGDPLSLFNMKSDSDVLALDRNFKTMAALIRVCGVLKVCHPELIRQGDYATREYIYRSKLATESTFLQLDSIEVPPYSNVVDQQPTKFLEAPGKHDPSSVYPKLLDAQAKYLELINSLHATGLDKVLATLEESTEFSKGASCVKDIPDKIRKFLRGKYSLTVFKVMKDLSSPIPDSYRVTIDRSLDVLETTSPMTVSESKEYPNILWFLRGDKFFDKSSPFFDKIINN